jgi:hypothetical protein
MQKCFSLFFFLWVASSCFTPSAAQKNIKDSVVSIPALQVSYSFQFPALDLAKRFGNNSNVALGFTFKNKTNWIFALENAFIFGNQIKENQILKNISTQEGYVIAANGQIAEVNLYQRGFFSHARFGRLFSFFAPNVNSGFYATVGIGFLQHKIRIDNVGNTAPQLSQEYKKGYDRLTSGLMISEFLGYSFLSNNRRVNFFAGFEFMQAFTKNKREYNYDLMEYQVQNRKDFLSGIRIGWVIPLYKKLPNDFYYY